MEYTFLGKGLMFVGFLAVVIGLAFMFLPQIPFLGKLPGDISIQSGNLKIFFPVVSCIILSLLLSLFLNLFMGRAR